jgi:hypothetical protein
MIALLKVCGFYIRFATLLACLPSAVRVDFGRWAIVRFFFAAAAAFLMFLPAAERCLAVAMHPPTLVLDARHVIWLVGRGRWEGITCQKILKPKLYASKSGQRMSAPETVGSVQATPAQTR